MMLSSPACCLGCRLSRRRLRRCYTPTRLPRSRVPSPCPLPPPEICSAESACSTPFGYEIKTLPAPRFFPQENNSVHFSSADGQFSRNYRVFFLFVQTGRSGLTSVL